MEVRRILAIDDDEDILTVVQKVLRRAGWEIHTAGSHEEAMALAATVRPELILLDMDMPGCDGACLLERLRGLPETAAVPVFFLSGGFGADDSDTIPGAQGLLRKPFGPTELPAQIRRLLDALEPSASA